MKSDTTYKKPNPMIPKSVLLLLFTLLLINFSYNQEVSVHPEIEFMQNLILVDEVDCSTENHDFRTDGTTEVKTILGKPCRVLLPSNSSSYFSYRLGLGKALQPGRAYFLEVEYPDDTDRNFVVQNRGGEYNRGIQTGKTLGDMYSPPYVQSNPESISLPHSQKFLKWQTLFWLHDRYAGLLLPRSTESSRPEKPENGFLVIICQFDLENNPFNNGAAVSAIRLYEAPDFNTLKAEINYPPSGLPRRHLFFREEMADGVVDANPPGVTNTNLWFEHKAQLMQFLGMNTYCKDLLEFGHNQGWDPEEYSLLINTPAWKDRWENILSSLTEYDMDVLPYYEYAGTIGPQGLGNQQKAHPLNDALPDHDYTHISWVENVNADITDPVTYDDLKKVLSKTIVKYKDQVHFTGAWIRPRPSQNPISFSNNTLERFRTEANGSIPVTRAQIKNDAQLYNRYLGWWYLKRKEFLLEMRDYLREQGVNDDAVILYTTDYSEPGKTHYDWGYSHNIITDDVEAWENLPGNFPVYDLNEYIEKDWHLQAQLLPENTWGQWEWQHSTPVPDPINYTDEEGVLLTYTFNKAYTVGSENAFKTFTNRSGLAIIRHYCLNESGMNNMGYFVADVEWHGPYTMLAEARAMASGDPWYIGYLSSSSFNKGSISYVRDFNTNYLALPALPSQVDADVSEDPEVIVRRIETSGYGTYYSIVNTGLTDKDSVKIRFPGTSDIKEASSGNFIFSQVSEIYLNLYTAQLKTLILFPSTGKTPQSIYVDPIPPLSYPQSPVQLNAQASSGLDVSWHVISGPGTVTGDSLKLFGPGFLNLRVVQPGNESFYPVSHTVTIRVDSLNNVSSIKHPVKNPSRIYPNPSSDQVYVELCKPSRFRIYNTLGSLFCDIDLVRSDYINISYLSQGIYIFAITDSDSTGCIRFIKEN